MASGTIRVEGLRELGEAFKLLADDIQNKVAAATTNAMAQPIKKAAQRKAPVAAADYEVDGVKVAKGNLPKQIYVRKAKKSEVPTLTSEHVVTIRSKKKNGYAYRVGFFQEYGTVKQPPHPFLRPAFDEQKEAAVAAGKQKLIDRIAKANAGSK